MSAAAVAVRRLERVSDDLLSAYAGHCHVLGLSASTVDYRLAAARRFLARHGDLAAWMTRPVPMRLTDLARNPLAWQLVRFTFLTGRVRADFDLLAAKHAGRSFGSAVVTIYPD